MKKRVLAGIALALGVLVTSSAFAAGCGACGDSGKCKDAQAVQQFRNETAVLAKELQTKDTELRNEYGLEGINYNRTGALEGEIKELKARIHAVADKLGIPVCCTV